LTNCTGAWGRQADNSLAGAELALIQAGARAAGANPMDGVLGAAILHRPIRLSIGCTNGTTVSALKEARRLVEGAHVDIVIGPLLGNEEFALQAYARLHPATAFVNGSGSVRLPDPAPNFFSFHGDGAQWSAGLGSYAYHVLGWRHAVAVTDDYDAFSWSQTAGFLAEFCSLGGIILKRVGVPSGSPDLSAVIAQVPHSGVDGIYVASNSDVARTLMKVYPALRGNAATRLLVGNFSVGWLSFHPSNRLKGFVWDQRIGPGGLPAGRFETALHAHFAKLDPATASTFDVDYYVAMQATLQALRASNGDLSHGERRFLAALARVRLNTPNGPVRLDKTHQAITTAYLWQVRKSRFSHAKLLKTIPNVERTFGGYLTSHDPPPSLSTPTCRQGHVPRWAS
jgi:branched-chain amino acid transport system substrate-binding protein